MLEFQANATIAVSQSRLLLPLPFDLCISLLAIVQSEILYHCDRRITFLSDTDIFFGLFILFTYTLY
jgi:hypothetical protein